MGFTWSEKNLKMFIVFVVTDILWRFNSKKCNLLLLKFIYSAYICYLENGNDTMHSLHVPVHLCNIMYKTGQCEQYILNIVCSNKIYCNCTGQYTYSMYIVQLFLCMNVLVQCTIQSICTSASHGFLYKSTTNVAVITMEIHCTV